MIQLVGKVLSKKDEKEVSYTAMLQNKKKKESFYEKDG